MAKGKFYVIEGMDGSGKSTQAGLLAQHLRSQGRSVVQTREPGGTELGRVVAAVINNGDLLPLTQLFLHCAARNEHLETVVLPALRAGSDVVCDRWVLSTYAYQGMAQGLCRKLDKTWSEILFGWMDPSLRADKCFILDVPLEIARKRLEQRGMDKYFDRKSEDFMLRVQRAYRDSEAGWGGYRLIDGSGTPEETFAAIAALL